MEKFEGVCLLLTAHVCRLASAREQRDCGGAQTGGIEEAANFEPNVRFSEI